MFTNDPETDIMCFSYVEESDQEVQAFLKINDTKPFL
jgi:hypothetical protein